MRLVLASSSPARLATLRGAGLHPEVRDPGISEEGFESSTTVGLVMALAEAKAMAVADQLTIKGPTIVVGCDTLLEFQGEAQGKPGTPEAAQRVWWRIRGREGVLHTGHHVIVLGDGKVRSSTRAASTTIRFADLTDEEIRAYAATGEPQKVAGGFTIDGIGGPFVTSIEGDPHNVVGLSLPLFRQMLIDLSVRFPLLWRPSSGEA